MVALRLKALRRTDCSESEIGMRRFDHAECVRPWRGCRQGEFMEFGSTIDNPLLQAAVCIGEETIRQACELQDNLDIHVEMDRLADGRDAIWVTLRSADAFGGFRMVFAKYFDRKVLWRVARHAWRQRVSCGMSGGRLVQIPAFSHAAGMN
jgi:hypothetical protein